MTNDEILDVGLGGLECCSHAPATEIERVRTGRKRVLWAEHDDGGWGPEHSMGALVELADGTFAVIYESEDSSGHGCQCSGDLSFFDTLEDALMLGVSQYDREKARAAVAESR